MVWSRRYIFQTIIFGIYVRFRDIYYIHLDLPMGAEWMRRAAYTPSLRVQTAPFGRCWYIWFFFPPDGPPIFFPAHLFDQWPKVVVQNVGQFLKPNRSTFDGWVLVQRSNDVFLRRHKMGAKIGTIQIWRRYIGYFGGGYGFLFGIFLEGIGKRSGRTGRWPDLYKIANSWSFTDPRIVKISVDFFILLRAG